MEKEIKYNLNDKISKYIAYLHRSNHSYVGKRLKKYNLKNTTFPILLNLEQCEANTVNKIARDMNIDKSIISRGVKELLNFEYIEKTPSLINKSSFTLFLTEKGREVLVKVHKVLQTWETTVFKDLEKEEKKRMVEILKKALKDSKEII